jgi:GNAT superfamily N-acetyltransferase
MSKNLRKVIANKHRGKVPIKKTVHRGGSTFQQTFWVTPAEARALREKAGQQTLAGASPAWQKHEKKVKRGEEFVTGAKDLLQKVRKEKETRAQAEARPDIDERALEDLWDFIENDVDLFRRVRGPIEKAAIKDWNNNQYSEKQLQHRFGDMLVSEGVDKYLKTFPIDLPPPSGMDKRLGLDERQRRGMAAFQKFPRALRDQLAKDMARKFTEAAKLGEYGEGGLRPEPPPPPPPTQRKSKLTDEMKQAVKGKFGSGKKGRVVVRMGNQRHFEEGAELVGLSSDDFREAYATPEEIDLYDKETDTWRTVRPEFEVTSVDLSHRPTGDWDDDGWVEIQGDILDEEGQELGEMARTIKRVDGRLVVSHDLLWMEPSAKGSGLGTQMILNQLEQYEEMGVDRVTLGSADIGRYLWLKVGFVPDRHDQAMIRERATGFIDQLDIDDDTKDMFQDLVDGDLTKLARAEGLPKVPYQYWDRDRRVFTTKFAPFNKAVLLDRSSKGWSGTLEVGGPDWSNTKEILYGYATR